MVCSNEKDDWMAGERTDSNCIATRYDDDLLVIYLVEWPRIGWKDYLY